MESFRTQKFQLVFLLIFVFISGYSALVYQVAWERLLKFQFGGDIISSSIITSIFLLGIGIGSFLFRKQQHNPLLIYFFLGLTLCPFALMSYRATTSVSELSLFISSNLPYLTPFFLNILFPSFFLLIPTIIFGATFPVYISIYKSLIIDKNMPIPLIYCINTFGGAIGIALVPTLYRNS